MRKNIALEKSLKKLGEDIKTARLRRRQPISFIADRSGVSVGTITKIEEGKPMPKKPAPGKKTSKK